VKNWLKFSLLGVANIVVCALWFLVLLFIPWISTSVLFLLYGAIFVAQGYLLYRLTKSSGSCRYLWTTILTYITLGVVIFVGIFLLSISATNASNDFWNDFGWVFLLITTAGLLIITLAFTVITCLTVWIIQIIKRKKLKCT